MVVTLVTSLVTRADVPQVRRRVEEGMSWELGCESIGRLVGSARHSDPGLCLIVLFRSPPLSRPVCFC